MSHRVLLPAGWAPPIGYSNGIKASDGDLVFIAGQVGWDEQQKFQSEQLVPQFERLYEREGKNFKRFYAEVARLAALPKEQRQATLNSI